MKWKTGDDGRQQKKKLPLETLVAALGDRVVHDARADRFALAPREARRSALRWPIGCLAEDFIARRTGHFALVSACFLAAIAYRWLRFRSSGSGSRARALPRSLHLARPSSRCRHPGERGGLPNGEFAVLT